MTLVHKCTVVLVCVVLFSVVTNALPTAPMRTIQWGNGTRQHVTMRELLNLRSEGYGFFDVTEHLDFGTRKAEAWEPTIPPCCGHEAFVRSLNSQLNVVNLQSTITTLSSFHTRYFESTTGQEASEWIYHQLQSVIESSYATGYAEVQFFNHTWTQPSVIARIFGDSGNPHAEELVIVGAHLDSIISGQSETPPYPRSPGADDDASGTSNVMEIFRVLVENNLRPTRTMEFHLYSAEEVGLRGSEDIATSYLNDGKLVQGMLQLDMTGYPKMEGPQLRMINDYTNPQLMDFLKSAATAYSSLSWYDSECGYPCSDHASFNETGFYSCRVKENGDYREIHTINDVIANLWLPYSLEICKVALGYAVELAITV